MIRKYNKLYIYIYIHNHITPDLKMVLKRITDYQQYINGNMKYGFENFQNISFCRSIVTLKSKYFSFTEKVCSYYLCHWKIRHFINCANPKYFPIDKEELQSEKFISLTQMTYRSIIISSKRSCFMLMESIFHIFLDKIL